MLLLLFKGNIYTVKQYDHILLAVCNRMHTIYEDSKTEVPKIKKEIGKYFPLEPEVNFQSQKIQMLILKADCSHLENCRNKMFRKQPLFLTKLRLAH